MVTPLIISACGSQDHLEVKMALSVSSLAVLQKCYFFLWCPTNPSEIPYTTGQQPCHEHLHFSGLLLSF